MTNVGGTLAVAAVVFVVAPSWRAAPALPLARGEVAAATVQGEVAVVGGFVADGSSSRRVDLYSPKSSNWRRAADLPVAVNHTFAAGGGGRLYVAGGYGSDGLLRAAWVREPGGWRQLPPLPDPD